METLPSLLRALAEQCELWIPRPVGDGVRFLPYRPDQTIELDQTPPAHPAKAILFPNPEVLFQYERRETGEITLLPPELPETPLVAFGIRSCDVRALDALDAVFLDRSIPDTTYRQRRERLCLIGMGCVTPAATCFCDRMGGGPFDAAGMDVQIIPLPGAYSFRILTERGRQLLASHKSLFKAGNDETLRRIEAVEKEGSLQTGAPVDFNTLCKAIKARRDDPYWGTLADACLGCGICTFVCPVCSCFSMIDTGGLRGGRRLRHWDACMFPTFTKEASGHNPRGEAAARVKQRFFHKFYYSVENGEPPGCVGCGRCVVQCPTSIDIREIIRYFQPGEV